VRPCESPDPEEDRSVAVSAWPGLCASGPGGQGPEGAVSRDSEVLCGRACLACAGARGHVGETDLALGCLCRQGSPRACPRPSARVCEDGGARAISSVSWAAGPVPPPRLRSCAGSRGRQRGEAGGLPRSAQPSAAASGDSSSFN